MKPLFMPLFDPTMDKMAEASAKEYLKARGCPQFVWEGGGQGLIKSWGDFVTEVEQGYCPDCSMDEYWNDLSIRELIHAIGWDADARQADERFASLLTATTVKHCHTDRKSDYDFWNYGYPKNATGFFLQEVLRWCGKPDDKA